MTRTDTAWRIITAPPARVFAALVVPRALEIWLPPERMRGNFEHFDAVAGGSYRLVLSYTDTATNTGKATADSDIVEARFVEIVPGDRVGWLCLSASVRCCRTVVAASARAGH